MNKEPLNKSSLMPPGSDSSRPGAAGQVSSIALKHATATTVAQALVQLFGERDCKIVADARTNTLFLIGDDATKKVVMAVVEKIDVPSTRPPGDGSGKSK